jgi:hypothetical protein
MHRNHTPAGNAGCMDNIFISFGIGFNLSTQLLQPLDKYTAGKNISICS